MVAKLIIIYRPRWRSDAVFDTFHALWRAILRSNSRSRCTLIHAQRATACILCLKSPLYLVLLFLVWKQYWKMVASTLLRFFLSSKGMDSTSRLVLAFSIHNLTMCKITNFSVNNQEKSEKFHFSTENNFKIEANADAMSLSLRHPKTDYSTTSLQIIGLMDLLTVKVTKSGKDTGAAHRSPVRRPSSQWRPHSFYFRNSYLCWRL